jgi:hypothetical protein
VDGLSDKERLVLIKRAVIACEGSVTHAASLLGIHITTLSRALNHHTLGAWWSSYKAKKQLERARARGKRKRLREKERSLIECGYEPALARDLARRPRGAPLPPQEG